MTVWLGVDAGSRNLGWCALRIVGRDVFWLASDCIAPAEYATLAEIAHEHGVDRAVIERPSGLTGGDMHKPVRSQRELHSRIEALAKRGNALIDTAVYAGICAGFLYHHVSRAWLITATTARRKMTGDQYADDAKVAARVRKHITGWPVRVTGIRANNAHTRDAALACLAQNRMANER